MAKSKTSKKQDAKKAAAKADAKAKAKAAAKLAQLVEDAKKASKAADKAAKAAAKAQERAAAAGAPVPKAKPSEAELLGLALRSAEAKLTEAERKVEALEQQIADLHRRDEQEVEEAVADAVVDAAVAATVEEAVIDAELAGATDAIAVEVVAEELDAIVAEAEPAPEEPSHDGEAQAAAEVFEETVPAGDLTPPLPEEPADDQPNESWTLLKLRAEARSRGLTGTSNLPKAALLERLRVG